MIKIHESCFKSLVFKKSLVLEGSELMIKKRSLFYPNPNEKDLSAEELLSILEQNPQVLTSEIQKHSLEEIEAFDFENICSKL